MKNKIIFSLFTIVCCLNTAYAWKVEKDGTTQMKLTDTGRLWIGADGAHGEPKMAINTTETTEDRALDAYTNRESGTNFAIVSTAAGSGADKNIALYGWASGATTNYGLYIANGYGYFQDKVGIGTLTPEAKVVVSDTTEATLQIEATDTDGNSHLQFIERNGADYYGMDLFYSGDTNMLTFRDRSTTSYTDRMSIFRTGDKVLDLLGGDGLANAWNTNSDRRLKKDIVPLKNSLQKVSQLRGVTYKWKDTNKTTKQQIGFIAQEVEQIVPEVISKPKNDEEFYSMDYSKLTAVLVEAVKELKNQNDALKTLVCQDHPDAEICIDTKQ